MGIGRRVKEARENMNLTQKELADMIGVTSASIANYENEVSHPKEPIMYALLNALNVDANYLFQDCVNVKQANFKVSLAERDHIKKYRTLDEYGKDLVTTVLDKEYARVTAQQLAGEEGEDENCIYLNLSEQPASAGTGTYLGPEAFRPVKVLANNKTRKAAFCVRVSGDSMVPSFDDGDIVLVAREPVMQDDVALVTLDGCGYIKRMGDMYLISENKKYAPIPFDEDVIVNGRVIGVLQPEWIVEQD